MNHNRLARRNDAPCQALRADGGRIGDQVRPRQMATACDAIGAGIVQEQGDGVRAGDVTGDHSDAVEGLIDVDAARQGQAGLVEL